mmetsp:Transcript_99226/g.286304  ORF Transcript_99226/g.286304 Transcript_99226/m.286304 type:complete len:225 (-) Transcript_99226:2338-3012(-)
MGAPASAAPPRHSARLPVSHKRISNNGGEKMSSVDRRTSPPSNAHSWACTRCPPPPPWPGSSTRKGLQRPDSINDIRTELPGSDFSTVSSTNRSPDKSTTSSRTRCHSDWSFGAAAFGLRIMIAWHSSCRDAPVSLPRRCFWRHSFDNWILSLSNWSRRLVKLGGADTSLTATSRTCPSRSMTRRKPATTSMSSAGLSAEAPLDKASMSSCVKCSTNSRPRSLS